jgi:DNA-binding PadR family transcriptional regulator
MTGNKIPSLGYALLGLLQGKPSSGYDLRKIFSSTSMKTYSDSPGAIYPALRRLEKDGLIRGTIEEGSGLRRRQIFRVTAKGVAELKKWITLPVTSDEIAGGYDNVLLRFAFSEHAVSASASLQILKSLESAIEAQLASMREEYRLSRAAMPRSGWLAFECGIRGTESLLDWARYAISTFEKEDRLKGGAS